MKSNLRHVGFFRPCTIRSHLNARFNARVVEPKDFNYYSLAGLLPIPDIMMKLNKTRHSRHAINYWPARHGTERWRRARAKGKRMSEGGKRSIHAPVNYDQCANSAYDLSTLARETKRSRYPSFKREFVTCKIAANMISLYIEGIAPRLRLCARFYSIKPNICSNNAFVL